MDDPEYWSDSSFETPSIAAPQPRRLTESEWIEENFDEISSVYSSFIEYLRTYAPAGLFQNLEFGAFCKFCYAQSDPWV